MSALRQPARRQLVALLLCAALSATACDRLYYKTMKRFGMEKRAIGALGNELTTMRSDVDLLITELEAAIKEADTFIKEMDAEKAAEAAEKS